jgi:hypothetical protein
MHVAFIATAIGANLVWIIALYSYRVISTHSSVVSSTAIKKRRRESAAAQPWRGVMEQIETRSFTSSDYFQG